MSAFALEDGVVYHTYSAYTRGLDGLWGMYQWLDRAPRGRNETMVRGFGVLRGPSGTAATTSTTASDAGGRLSLGSRRWTRRAVWIGDVIGETGSLAKR